MQARKIVFTLLVAASTLTVASEASATNYTLWIHGRNTGTPTAVGKYTDFSYWGSASTAAGVNKIAVNWGGTGSISATNGAVRNALDCYCTGTNWCYIAVHSAGDLQIGYALAQYGTSTRTVMNAAPNASGVCTGSAGKTQVGWNIKWVNVAGGAGGGSELADAGSWATGNPIDSDLTTTRARAMYDHSTTRSVWFYNFAGAAGTLYSAVLPGQDDEVVAYHSSGGVSGSAGGSYCNPSDWFCNDLNLSTSACEGGTAKWGYHSLAFRDDSESANHYGAGTWSGIISPMRTDTVNHAR